MKKNFEGYQSLLYEPILSVISTNILYTVKYPKNNLNVQGIKNDSTIFYNKYTSLYNDVNECDSYRNLLNSLKT